MIHKDIKKKFTIKKIYNFLYIFFIFFTNLLFFRDLLIICGWVLVVADKLQFGIES